MNSAPTSLNTAAGELRVQPLSPEALQGLEALFPSVGTIEHEGRELLALATSGDDRHMHGLRTGYGWYEGEQASVARRAALYGRMRVPAALVAFRERGFDGVVMAGACVMDAGEGSTQEGELLFVHARRPLAGGVASEPRPSWEQSCGPHTTTALLTLVEDVAQAWKQGGVRVRRLTDIEPCPANSPAVRWFADVVLVGRRFVLVRVALDDQDPLLGALVEAGVDEVEWTPSAFVVPTESDEA